MVWFSIFAGSPWLLGVWLQRRQSEFPSSWFLWITEHDLTWHQFKGSRLCLNLELLAQPTPAIAAPPMYFISVVQGVLSTCSFSSFNTIFLILARNCEKMQKGSGRWRSVYFSVMDTRVHHQAQYARVITQCIMILNLYFLFNGRSCNPNGWIKDLLHEVMSF